MKYLLIITGLLISLSAFSQTLRGRIVDTFGKPVPAASVYVEENKQGAIANPAGDFQIRFSPGIYHLEVRCMGYETQSREIKIINQDLELVIELTEKDFQLQEVEVHRKEDPAYEIMRQAIKMAPYYQSVVKESTYKAYSKGAGKVTHIPKLINSMSNGDLEIYRDKLFMQESVSEIKFTAPDKYEQNIVAYSGTFPNGNDPNSALLVGMASLYHPMYGGAVSPLHPKAFDYYQFRYEGYEEENDRIINKIRIIPKLKDSKLMTGIIYIADEEWNIRHAEITVSRTGLTMHITLNYYPVLNNIFLVTTYESKMEMNLLGMKLNADFLASIQYQDIQLNDSLIAAGRKNLPVEKKKEKKSLEIKADDYRKKTVDSLAVKRDSLYWSEVRTVVLNEEELKSYERKDTMQLLTDSINRAEDNPKFKPIDLLMGGKLGNDSSLMYFHYSGLLGAFSDYNFVDGLWMGQSVGFDFKKKKNTGFRINSSVYWTSAREKMVWEAEIRMDYAPKRLGSWTLSAGRQSEDFSGEAGMNRNLNMLYSLSGLRNYAKFYDKDYGRLSNEIDICNGLQLGFGYEVANRHELANHTTWNFFGVKNRATPNIPEYNQALNVEYSDLAQYNIRLKYTPEYYYRMEDGKKRYVRSRFPTFELDYRQGIHTGSFGEHHSEFRRLELSVKQRINRGVFNRLNYTFIVGKYFNHNPFNYIDYKHFSTNGPGLTFKDWKDSYVLLPYYTHSTGKEWIQAFVNYNTDYLLLKRLPFLQGKLFTETLQGKFLHTPDKKYYSEWGYSVDFPFGLGGAGVFAAFDSFRYNGFGVQFTIPLFSILKKGNNGITITVGN